MSLKNCHVNVQLATVSIDTNTVNKRAICAHFLNFRDQLRSLEILETNSTREANFKDQSCIFAFFSHFDKTHVQLHLIFV